MNACLANVADETKNLRSLKLIIGDIDIVFYYLACLSLQLLIQVPKSKGHHVQ